MAGVALGAAAGALWALTFIAPELVEPWGPLELTAARYLVFGLCSAAGLALLRFNPLRRLGPADWGRVCLLGLLANVLYYLAAGQAIQMTGPTPVALVVGTLPVGVAVAANLRRRAVAWRRLLPPLAVISAGLAVVTLGTPDAQAADAGAAAAGVGVALAVVGLVSWLAYAVLNAGWLTGRDDMTPLVWTCLTGVGTLVVLVPVVTVALAVRPGLASAPEGASAAGLVAWGLTLGLAASYVATWLWNGAGTRLPAALLGYVIVSETLFAMAYDCVVAARPPSPAEGVAAVLILGGVAWGLAAAGARARGPAPARAADPAPGRLRA
ncbi:EamA family transporter [Miltoncostaea marina]|uniref:EamA family transporter n=1 Tax=Miltoncostaea marina TaxID=2843215 RepID=UPI001C3DBEE8|nr:EamA family transporter [Miltoncostaea marina]